ncbi:MAG: dockerin type I repeat-containing protein, partial [Thermoguttaceae bacterium]|nr:dockerin type I repeat-containing protein [Thermoguttaceae bacterium]
AYTDAGIYTTYVKVSREGYNDWTGSATVVINKVTPSTGPVEACISVTATVPTATQVNEVETLTEVAEGDTVYVSVYVKSTDSNYGIQGGYSTLYYDAAGFTAGEYTESAIFNESTYNDGYSYPGDGYISTFGGFPTSMTAAYGQTQWALVGTFSFTADAAGEYTFSTGTPRNAKGNEKETWGYVREDFADTEEYGNPVTSLSITVTGAAPTPDIEDVTLTGWTGAYDGAAHSITVNDPEASTDTILYSTDGVTYNLTSNPAYTDAGIYTTYVKVSRAGYNDWTGSATVTILTPLEAPTILTGDPGVYVSYGANRHCIVWTAVENASGYRLAYSSNNSDTWTNIETTETSAVVTGLTYGDVVIYRVRALGTEPYADSAYSAVRSFNVCPMDINNDGDVSMIDRTLMMQSWLSGEDDEEFRHYADVDGDGYVTNRDLVYLFRNWLDGADEEDLFYPPELLADTAFTDFASADLDIDFDVF